MSMRSLILTTVLICILFRDNGWARFDLPFSTKIHRCIDSISKAVKFCETKPQNLTIDSLIALAILRDSLSDICFANQFTPRLMEEICHLSSFLGHNFKSMSDHKSSHELAFLIKLNWYNIPFYEVNGYDLPNSEEISMQDYEGCIIELANHFGNKCDISGSCANQFLKGPFSGLNLLKQAFYNLVALRTSCHSEEINSSHFAYKSSILSQTLMTEFPNYYSVRNFSTNYRQHLLEQIIYGGLGGYLQMAHPVMMDEIISWQDESGCFKTVMENELILPDSIHFEGEVQFKDGCLLRLTSLSAAALAMHIRRFSIADVYQPDFYRILNMENAFAQNDEKFPEFIESKLDYSRSNTTPYANVPDTVL